MENDYEIGEPDGYVCKECESTMTIKTFNRLTDNGEKDPECEYCRGSEIVPMTIKDKPKVEDLTPMQKFRIVYIATERQDTYWEDDNGVEHQGLDGSPEVRFSDVFHKTNAVLEVAKACEEIGEENASNPPYDTYSVKMIYDLCTMIPYAERYFIQAMESQKEYERGDESNE